jgi:hypothetical protein
MTGPPDIIWHGTVVEVGFDELTVDLRCDGESDLIGDVPIKPWGLEGCEVGDLLELNVTAGTVKRLDLGTWTQADVDDIQARAHRRWEKLMKCIE